MNFIFQHFKKLDWALIVSALLLFVCGLLSIYSSSLSKGDFTNFKKQIVFGIIGIFFLFLLSFFNWRFLRDSPYFLLTLYFVGILSLIGLFFFASEIRGVRKWYQLGYLSFDPMEFMNIILIAIFARYFSTKHIEMYNIKHIILSGFYIVIPFVLLFFQPDVGSILIIVAFWVGILLISGIKLRHFLIMLFLGVFLFLLMWNFFMLDYQRLRIISFLNPTDPLGASWNQNQAKIAIGSGGIFGKGFTKGSQVQLGFLPEPQTDFVFSAFAEEFGLIGVILLFILFAIFFWRIIVIALQAKSNFPRLFATGFAIILFVKLFINIGMNIGIIPIIGIPLPLISYGGSNLLAIFLGLGILQSIKAR